MSEHRLEQIRHRLAPLQAIELHIADESHLHAGHAGAQGGAGHYRLTICAEAFRGKSPVARHRLVYDLLQDLMPHEIHALAIHASVPPAPAPAHTSAPQTP